jgi:hypothetical protein
VRFAGPRFNVKARPDQRPGQGHFNHGEGVAETKDVRKDRVQEKPATGRIWQKKILPKGKE